MNGPLDHSVEMNGYKNASGSKILGFTWLMKKPLF